MVACLGDLMGDITDFSWQVAKVAHAVWLCNMECGSLTWKNEDRIEENLQDPCPKTCIHG